MYRFALYTLKNAHDAEDAASEAVTDAWAQIRSLRDAASFQAWIFRILANKCKRRSKAYLDAPLGLPEDIMADDAPDADEALDVRSAFMCLSEEERMVLSLRIFGGYSSEETGKVLHMRAGTVRSKQKRALKKMGRLLSNGYEEVY